MEDEYSIPSKCGSRLMIFDNIKDGLKSLMTVVKIVVERVALKEDEYLITSKLG